MKNKSVVHFNYLGRISLYGVFLIAALLGTGCSTANISVMPGENSIRIVSSDIERDTAESEAIAAANKYCEDRNLTAVFIKTETKYVGSMNEESREVIRTASKAAMMFSGPGRGGSIHDPVHQAGSAGYASTSDRDYRTEIEFKCK